MYLLTKLIIFYYLQKLFYLCNYHVKKFKQQIKYILAMSIPSTNLMKASMMLCLLLLVGCNNITLPSSDSTISETSMPDIYPDYREIVIPPNIAPLNFRINTAGNKYIASLSSTKNDEKLMSKGKNVQWDEDDWHDFMEANRGNDVECSVYVGSGDSDKWRKYTFPIHVSEDDIDPYISYRLIEPTFVYYNEILLNQRNLTNFDEKIIHNNSYSTDDKMMSCMNCHVPRNHFSGESSQFHVRGHNGGTIIIEGDDVKKVDFSHGGKTPAGVYQAWHPVSNVIAYSQNGTEQYFFTRDPQKVEVLDEWSDLILYDVDKNSVKQIFPTSDRLETFPAWSPDGATLYFSCARIPDNAKDGQLKEVYDSIRYDILSVKYDADKGTFASDIDTVFSATGHGKSASLPRISPDGKYMLTCVSDFGTFHIWHKEADLWITDLASKVSHPLENANSKGADSYHSWSSNNRWIVFSSRRDDGFYTRPYICHIDEKGKASKAFIVPQKSPDYYESLMKSYNVPEFMVREFKVPRRALVKAIESKGIEPTVLP